MIFYIILTIILIAADFYTKYLVDSGMALSQTIPLIENVFHLTYVRNTGAAFSMLAGSRVFLIAAPIIIIAAIIVYIVRKKPQNKFLLLSFSLIIAGGTGNLVDRIRFGYVIDFFDFRLINFAVFNVADIFVCVGAALFIFLLIFSKDGDIL